MRRAVSSAYYAMFHALCAVCARTLAGPAAANTDAVSWTLAYRALDHAYAKNRFQSDTGMERFSSPLKHFGEEFVRVQAKRIRADYDPTTDFSVEEATQVVEDAADAIAQLRRTPSRDLRALSLYLLLRPRRD